jgi:hypothetical protein
VRGGADGWQEPGSKLQGYINDCAGTGGVSAREKWEMYKTSCRRGALCSAWLLLSLINTNVLQKVEVQGQSSTT